MGHLQHWSRFRLKTDITGSREWQWIKVFCNFFIGLQILGKLPSRSTEEAMTVVALIFAYCNIVVNSYLSLCVLLLKYHNRKKPNPYLKLYSTLIQQSKLVGLPFSYSHEKYTQCKALNLNFWEKLTFVIIFQDMTVLSSLLGLSVVSAWAIRRALLLTKTR